MRLPRRTLRDDAGFTVTELLLALVIGSIIMVAAFTLLDVVMRRAGEVDQRVDTAQRGRMLMDTLTRELRSQICMTTDVPPIKQTTEAVVGGSYQQAVSFYTDLTDGRSNAVPDLRTLLYDENTRTITESVYLGALVNGVPSYPAAPSRTPRVVGVNVVRELDSAGNPLPIFRFFGFTTSTGPTDPATPTKALPNAMAEGSPSVKMVAKIGVNFETLPLRKQVRGRTSTVFTDDVYVRAANPNDPAPIPTCV